MESSNNEWHNAFVMGTVKDKHFFVIIEKGISAMLTGAKDVKPGDFYSVKYVFNQNATKANRAQHIVTQYAPVEPLGPVRIEKDERGNANVLIRTKAKFCGMVVNENNKSCARLHNSIFGYFIDIRNLIRVKDKLVEFEFKCKSSENDQYKSIFIPVKVIGYSDLPFEEERYCVERKRNCQAVTGFVCSQVQPDGKLFLWSRSLDRDAVLDPEFCPNERNPGLCGFWVDAWVDEATNRVVDMVEVINDVYPSRVERGVPEVNVYVEHDGFYQEGKFEIFRSPDFGLICDPEHMITNFDKYKRYLVWVVRQKTSIPGCKWKISPAQPRPEPERDRLRYYQDRPYSRNSSPLRPPSSSEFNDRSSRHSEVQNREVDSQNYHRTRDYNRAPTSEDDSDGETGLPTVPRNGVSSSLEDVTPARRRQRALTSDSSDMSEDDGKNDTCNHKEYNHRNGSIDNNSERRHLSRPTVTGLETPARSDRGSVNSNYATPMADIQNTSSASARVPSYELLEKQITLQKEKMDRLTYLVKFFTRDPKVHHAMTELDAQKFEELMRSNLD